jgi:membrane associated rhomboid family serine protease
VKLIIPWAVDVPRDRHPVMNYVVIGIILLFFSFQVIDWLSFIERRELLRFEIDQGNMTEEEAKGILEELQKEGTGVLVLRSWRLREFFGHMWLHGGIIHLLGNLIFLWVFGNAVCSKIGGWLYFPFYIFFGLSAAFFHQLFIGGSGGMAGASGAINGVVGMYLFYFAENDITCYFTVTLGDWHRFTVSSYKVILVFLLFDILGAILGGSGVAYFAHLGGFAAGFGVALLLLKIGVVEMERYEKSLLQIFAERKEGKGKQFETTGYAAYLSKMVDETVGSEEKRSEKPKEAGGESVGVKRDDAEKVRDEYIRFVCFCGKQLKMPLKYGGRVGKCPACGKRLKIPEGRVKSEERKVKE